MSPERSQSERKIDKETLGIIVGFFAGKEDEINQEIKEVESWPTNIRLGAKVKRKDQELEHLNKLKDELKSVRNFILNLLGYQNNNLY